MFQSLSKHNSYQTLFTITRCLCSIQRQHKQSSVTGLFGVEQLSTKTFHKYWSDTYTQCEQLRNQIVSGPHGLTTVQKFDEMSNKICCVADACNFISENHSQISIMQTAREVSSMAVQYVEVLNTDVRLYEKLKLLAEDAKVWDVLGETTRQVTKMFLFDFEQSGIHLESETREQFVEINNEVFRTGFQMTAEAVRPVKVPLARCPTSLFTLPQKDNHVIVSTSGVSSRHDEIREETWKLYFRFEKQREETLCALLKSRHRLALTSGFPDFCTRELRGTMAQTPRKVHDFLSELNHKLSPLTQRELAHFSAVKGARSTAKTPQKIYTWDVPYYATLCKSTFLQERGYAAFHQKFTLEKVMSGTKKLTEKIFNLRLVEETVSNGEIWAADIFKYSVRDDCDRILGFIYCDFYQRTGKDNRVCLHTIRCGTKTQTPIVAILCDFVKDAELVYGEVENFYHEYGHALHAIIGRTEYQHVSGTRCPTDFAEIPSILLETLVSNHSVICDVLDIPTSPQPNIAISQVYQAAETQIQVYYAMLDHVLHSSSISNTTEISVELQEKYLHLPVVPGTAWHHRFTHLFYYGARYYSYLWARSIVNTIIQTHFPVDKTFSPESTRLISELLSHGGSRDPRYLVENLIGSTLTVDKMVVSLVTPLSRFSEKFVK